MKIKVLVLYRKCEWIIKGVRAMENQKLLHDLLNKKYTQPRIFEIFDSLATVDINDLWGFWKGSEIKTGHPMEGILSVTGWYGKRFVNSEQIDPLVFRTEKGKLFYVNPGLIPLELPIEKLPKKILSMTMKWFGFVVKTNKSRARVRRVKFQGKTSASMIYDQKAIIDVFRKINDDTLLGVMDIKDKHPEKYYFFVLQRVTEQSK